MQLDILGCEADLEVNKHVNVACGYCHVVWLGNTEPGYYDNGPDIVMLCGLVIRNQVTMTMDHSG